MAGVRRGKEARWGRKGRGAEGYIFYLAIAINLYINISINYSINLKIEKIISGNKLF